MIQVLLVSTVLSKKQFTVETFNKFSEFNNALKELYKTHPNLIIFPLCNNKDVENVEDLLSDKELKDCKEIIRLFNPENRQLGFKLHRTIVKHIIRIEHFHDEMYRISTEEGNFITDAYKFSLYA